MTRRRLNITVVVVVVVVVTLVTLCCCRCCCSCCFRFWLHSLLVFSFSRVFLPFYVANSQNVYFLHLSHTPTHFRNHTPKARARCLRFVLSYFFFACSLLFFFLLFLHTHFPTPIWIVVVGSGCCCCCSWLYIFFKLLHTHTYWVATQRHACSGM